MQKLPHVEKLEKTRLAVVALNQVRDVLRLQQTVPILASDPTLPLLAIDWSELGAHCFLESFTPHASPYRAFGWWRNIVISLIVPWVRISSANACGYIS